MEVRCLLRRPRPASNRSRAQSERQMAAVVRHGGCSAALMQLGHRRYRLGRHTRASSVVGRRTGEALTFERFTAPTQESFTRTAKQMNRVTVLSAAPSTPAEETVSHRVPEKTAPTRNARFNYSLAIHFHADAAKAQQQWGRN